MLVQVHASHRYVLASVFCIDTAFSTCLVRLDTPNDGMAIMLQQRLSNLYAARICFGIKVSPTLGYGNSEGRCGSRWMNPPEEQKPSRRMGKVSEEYLACDHME